MPVNWSELTAVSRPGASANPVLKLTFGATIFWLKAAPGGQRIAFAGTVMQRVGFRRAGAEVLTHDELERLALFPQAQFPAVKEVIDLMRERLRRGEDLVLLEHVGGDGTYEENVYGKDFDFDNATPEARNAAIRKHIELIQSPRAQEDLARMIAADLLLGNFDRAAISNDSGGDSRDTHFHMGNFIYDAATQGFLPIDNDMVAPSLEHIPRIYQGTGKERKAVAATKLDLYRTAILGGGLLSDGDVFAKPQQADISALLGPNA